jgi:hypothetical protein
MDHLQHRAVAVADRGAELAHTRHPCLGCEAAVEHHLRARKQRAVDRHELAGHVEHRVEAVGDVVHRQAHAVAGAARRQVVLGMGEKNGLGRPRRARGVKDGGKVTPEQRLEFEALAVAGNQFLPR